ncbi:MAG: hypothetical protein AB1598_06075 [Thermodesulfobacteriota bacterium]
MYKKSGSFLAFLLLISFTAGAVLVTGPAKDAWGQQGCQIEVIKAAIGEDTSFDFTRMEGDLVLGGFTLVPFDGAFVTVIGPGTPLTVVENVPDGWRLEDVICFNDGVAIEEIENGFIATCTAPGEGFAECTFYNVQLDVIPTLSEWGMIAAAAGLMIVGVFFAVRRRRAAV